MTSDDDDRPALSSRGLNFDSMSIDELEAHITALTAEIERVKAMIAKKKTAQDAAAGFFKS